MKAYALFLGLICSFSAIASERVVLEISKREAKGELSTRFEVNLQDKTAGASLTSAYLIQVDRQHRMITRTFEKVVPELSLVGDDLVYETLEGSVVCGTMGETRVFKKPVLKLSGECKLITRTVNNKVQLVLVTK